MWDVRQGAVDKVPAPREVVAALHRHFLGAADPELRCGGGAGSDAEAERILCTRAIAALYHAHTAAVGARPARTLAGRARARSGRRCGLAAGRLRPLRQCGGLYAHREHFVPEKFARVFNIGVGSFIKHPANFVSVSHCEVWLPGRRMHARSSGVPCMSTGLQSSSPAGGARRLATPPRSCAAASRAAAAGPFEGVAHVVALLDATLSKPLRHSLLRLAEALLLPAAARGDEAAAAAAAANADAFTAAGGVQLAVDLVAGAGGNSSLGEG